MKLIKPSDLGLLTRPFTLGGAHRLAVAVIGFFNLGAANVRFLEETSQWPRSLLALPLLEPLDEVYPKPVGEVLLAGRAHAPGGNPVEALDVRMQLGTVDKTLRVWGDRRWYYGPWYRTTAPQPFVVMPLGPDRSFGGAGHAANPEGRGYTGNPLAGWIGRNEGQLPNVERPDRPVRGHVQHRQPAGFGPLNPSRPPRRRYAGTFGTHWREHHAPGLPADLDPRFFLRAAADQWSASHWQGGEAYRLDHLHPQHPAINGHLPTCKARAFIRHHADGSVQELAVMLDTVWFMPDQMLGVLIFHGSAPIQHVDALDVDAVLAAYEHPGQARPAAHYEEALRLRTDPQTALYHALVDQPLVPEDDPAVRAARRAERESRVEEARAGRQAALDEIMAEQWQALGRQAPAGTPPPRVAPMPALDLEGIRCGDVSLQQWVESMKTKADAAQVQGQERLEATRPVTDGLQQEHRQVPDREEERRKLHERASQPAWDLLDACPLPDPALNEALAAAVPHLSAVDPGAVATARAQLAQLPALQRRGRRSALRPVETPLAPTLAAWLGDVIRQWLQAGVSLVGRNLSGASLRGIDLSDADLRETVFEGCDLTAARFTGANLRQASFVGATCNAADFSGSQLNEANFSACTAHAAKFYRAHLRKACAVSADFRGSCFDDAVLDELLALKTDFTDASFCGAKLDKAQLLELRAGGSRWVAATLDSCNLTKAELPHSDFSNARLTRCVLLDAQLDHSVWAHARLERCLAMGAKLLAVRAAGLVSRGSGWRGSAWQSADLTGAKCLDSDFGNADLTSAVLRDGVFARSLFQGATLAQVDATGADFWRALCRHVDFSQARLRDANLRQATLGGARFHRTDVKDARFDARPAAKLRRARGEEVLL